MKISPPNTPAASSQKSSDASASDLQDPDPSSGKPGDKKPNRRSKKKLLWLIAIIPALLLIIAGSLYGYFIHKYQKNVYVKPSYVDSWEQLPDASSTQSDSDPTAVTTTIGPDDVQPPTPTGVPVEPPKLDDVKGTNDPIIKKTPIDENIENLLIIGIDGTDIDNEGHRSDTMLIVSINKSEGTVKLVSVMRDTWAYYPNKKCWNKINASYAWGGPGQTVNIINENLDLDIQEYVVLDFAGFEDVVDLIGGLQIELTDKEAGKVIGKKTAGSYLLNGEQALAYARIRKIDSDFVRVQRQRNVILTIFKELRGKNPADQYSIAVDSLQYMRSNISGTDITGRLFELALKVDSNFEQMTVPGKGMYKVHNEDSWYMSVNWDKQAKALHTFLYGE